MLSPKRLKDKIVHFALTMGRIGHEDPRRIIHGFKVGLAITIASLFYYIQPLYNYFESSAMWAIPSVIVVFEFSVGATLVRSLNWMIATCLSAFLGLLAYQLAALSGKIGEVILISFFIFLIAGLLTFMRFLPRSKTSYDLGFLLFIAMFCLVSVSGYQVHDVALLVLMVAVGTLIAVFVCVCICPVWSGTELHNLIASNLEKLANSLEGVGDKYFKATTDKPIEDKSSRDNQYTSVLDSPHTEANLANFAAWEPRHLFRFRLPWKQYLKIGEHTRQCTYIVDALIDYLNSDIQMPPEIQASINEACTHLRCELSLALKELVLEIKNRKISSTKEHINKLKSAVQDLKSLFQVRNLWEKFNLGDFLPAATIASLLMDIANCIEGISEGINELAFMADFKLIRDVSDQINVLEQGNP